MKKTTLRRGLFVLASALLVFGLPCLASAHSPQKIDVSYDFASQTLVVQITHTSNNPDRHFVKEVEVKKNGHVVQRGIYTKQAGDTFTYTYPVAATGADTFEVAAACNLHGSKTVKFSPGT